jgi:hypothetical protein
MKSESKARGYFERRLADVVDRLTRAGYSDIFRAEHGAIRAEKARHLHRPEDLAVEALERFEGVSDPSDEAIVVALCSRVDACRGTYTVPYGEGMPAEDAALIARFPDTRRGAGPS